MVTIWYNQGELPQLRVEEPLTRRSFAKAGTGRGCFPPHRSCARSDQAVRLGTPEEAPEDHCHLQMTQNSLMG
jgi:hypothetical protein